MKTKPSPQIAHGKAQSGIRRAEHFAAGGTVEAWRGKHSVERDRKREASRKACRGNKKET